jgi:hypothetical protein
MIKELQLWSWSASAFQDSMQIDALGSFFGDGVNLIIPF